MKAKLLPLFVVAILLASLLTASVAPLVPPAGAPPGLLASSDCGPGVTPGAAAPRPAAYQALAGPHLTKAQTLAHDGVELVIGPEATPVPVTIGITPLSDAELPRLDTGMTNVTQERRGYRFTPHPYRFAKPIQISVPYDPGLVGTAFRASDVHTYYFDDRSACWRPLERVRVDEKKHVVVSRTDHFTDMVNATVAVPDHPETTTFNPNQIRDLQAANPGVGVNLIAAPGPNSTGDARLSYPIEVPPGRGGMQPNLAVRYSSGGGNGWLGQGWDLPVPSITVDTRWGVPRYDSALETETYLLDGAQLTPVANRGQLPARSAEKVFHTRTEGEFARIIRHGSAPANYAWEIIDKAGTRSLYGGTAASTLADDAGHVFQWALREVRDVHGNIMRYRTVRQDDTGMADGGSVPGRNLYLQKITYAGRGADDGSYAVTFIRDRELEEERRPDVSIDARGGFKRVTADLLRRVEVTLDGLPIRRYELAYTTGAFMKTLLRSVSHLGEDGKVFTTHDFGYYDDIRDSGGQYRAFAPLGWTSPDDNVRNGAVDVVGGAGEAGALNGNTSTSVGGHLYVGFGGTRSKSGSVGVKTGYSSGQETGLLALTDVDGDGLPDKVFRGGGGVVYRRNLSRPGGQPRFGDDVLPLRNLPGILSESSETTTVGVEAYLGVAAQLDHVDTFTRTDRYLTDVNADGITDLVDRGSVLFGRIGPDGTPVYGVSGDTPVPIGSAPVDKDRLLRDYTADRERQIDSHPLVDTVRRWVAPYDGTVAVTGAVRLVEDADRSARADGVRVAVQHESAELWSHQIAATDNDPHGPVGVDAVPVKRGDRLYFRVQSGFDGTSDRVSWDPQISYLNVPEVTDVNGLGAYEYRASRDFTLGGRTTAVTVPVTGTVHLSGALTKKVATTDDVTAIITRGDDTVFERTLPAAQAGEIPIDLDIPVEKGQQLRWRVRIDSPIDLGQIEWTPKVEYTAAQGVQRLSDANGDPALTAQPPYDVDMYPADGLTAPQESYTAPAAGTLIVQPVVTAESPVTFTVKKRGALLAKKVVTRADTDARLSVPVEAGEELFLDFSTLDRRAFEHSVQVGFDPESLGPAPSARHTAAEEGAFAQPYRGWGVIGYNGNRDRAGRPIAQAELVADEHYRDDLPTDVDPQRDRDRFTADPRVTPPKFFQYTPAPAGRRWEAGAFSFATADAASSSRLGSPAITVPEAADFADVTAVSRLSRSTQISLTGSVGGGVISVGGSIATGNSVGELDYLDMNGDQFPDVVGANGVQYTDPTGQLGGTRSAIPDGNVRRTGTEAGNAGAGSAARTITTGWGHAAPPASGSANTAEAGNDLPPLSFGGNLGTGASNGVFDLLDINGDELPDRVYADGRAALNLGYRFAAPEPWPGGALNSGGTRNTGVNIGFNTDFYGFAGGASFTQGRSSTEDSLLDVNGDGLADRVFDGNPIRVALNTGSGFAAPQPFQGSLSGVNEDVNARLGAGGYFTFSFCFGIIVACVITNPGADTSTGASRAEQALRDINGDGYVDHLRSTADNQLVVAENQTGRTNLLKSVQRPMKSRIDLDYTRDGNTYDQPQSRFVLSRVAVDDGQPGDGQDVQLSTYRYSGGSYDRLERQFNGYRSVVTEQRDPGAGDAVHRTVTVEYLNDSPYTQGLVGRELTADAAGRAFTETRNTYVLRDVNSPTAPADPRSTTATIFPQLVRTDQRFFEGQAEPGKSTSVEMSYDEFGNVVREVDTADAGAADDVETRIRYAAEDRACRDRNIVGVPKNVDVRGNGALMRHRESTVDCATGNVTQHRAVLADGDKAITDLTYFDNGNIRSVTGPPNAKGERYRLEYEYDPATATHVTSTRDSFGYRSTASYNLKYGRVEASTDINDQVIRYDYDAVGRVHTITGPHETAENHPTVDYEYHPEATVPYAVTRNIDRNADGTIKRDSIDTITFADGLKRVLQTKKDAALATGPDTPPVDAMIISGRAKFDFLGRTVEQFYPTSELKGPLNTTFRRAFDTVRPTRVGFDVLDRPIRTALPDDTVSTVAYGFGPDRAGTTQFEAVTTDAKGNVKRTYTDVRQLTTAVKEANPSGGQAVIWTSYAYNPLGQITKVVDDQNNATTTTYDNLGRRTVLDNPDGGRTETVYDLADNPVKEITANLAEQRKAIEYKYDFNRLAAIRYPIFDENDVTYRYGAPGAPGNAANRVVEVEDAAGTLDREYGPLGEVTKETRTVPGFSPFTTRYRYNTWNRVQQMTYPDGEVLSYRYNSGGLVDGATGVKGSNTYPYLRRLEYDKFEQRALLETGNGTRTTFTYTTADRRLATLRATLPTGAEFQHTDYAYDAVGNITSTDNGTVKQSFGYDDLYRLTSSGGEYQPTSDITDRYQVAMSYDSINNVTRKDQRHEIVASSTVVQRDTTYQYAYEFAGDQPHAPTGVGPFDNRYDKNGNLVSRTESGQRRQLVWDEENRLRCVRDGSHRDLLTQEPASCPSGTDVRFSYDDQGTRVVKDAGRNNVSVYPSQSFEQRNLTAFKHVFVGETRLVSKMVEPERYLEANQFYFHPDHLGSTGYGTDKDGRVVEHLRYFPSGETWVEESAGEPTPYQFSGKELDEETGLHYHGARYYDARTGVWQSPDPESSRYLNGEPNGGVYQSVNLAAYTYSANNPIRYGDPTGRSWSDFWEGAKSGAIGGAVTTAIAGVGMGVLAVTAPAWVPVATVGVAAAGVAGLAYTGYRAVTAETGAERHRIAGEVFGGVATGAPMYVGAQRLGSSAVTAIRGVLTSPKPRSLGAAVPDDPPPSGGGGAAAATAETAASRLTAIASDVHGLLKHPAEINGRTAAIMQMTNGEQYAANAGHSFTSGQRALLAQHGIKDIGFTQGVHAEVQLLNFAAGTQRTMFPLQPRALGTSRDICTGICQPAIRDAGGRILPGSPRTAVWD